MKVQHTPGPWEVYHMATEEGRKNTFRHSFIIVTPDTVDHNNEIGIATEKIISAAPDLLEALEEFIKLDNQPKFHGNMPVFLRDFRNKAITAIKKAKGL